jgi:hypothetical protein
VDQKDHPFDVREEANEHGIERQSEQHDGIKY